MAINRLARGHQHSKPAAAGAVARRFWPSRRAASRSATRSTFQRCFAGWPKTAFRTPARSSCPASFRRAAASSTSSPPTGTTRCGSSSSATRSNRSAASRSPASAAWHRSIGSTSRVLPADAAEQSATSLHELPAAAKLVPAVEPAELEEEARHYRQRAERPQDLHDTDDALAAGLSLSVGHRRRGCQRLAGDRPAICGSKASSGSAATSPRCATSSTRPAPGNDVFIVCQTEAEVERLREIFGATQLAAAGPAALPDRPLASRLSHWCSERIVLVSGSELFHRTDLSRPTRRRLGRVIDSFLELREGRLRRPSVARHRPLSRPAAAGEGRPGRRAPGARVPRRHEDLSCRPRRSSWCRNTSAAARARADAGAHRRQDVGPAEGSGRAGGHRPGGRHARAAGRARRRGRASRFRPTPTGSASSTPRFPISETPDQLTAIAAIKHDMQQPRPMDRLLCGDVGYGKTELAMRAAFKAVDAGYQVAVLVPTTILAEQHRRTFTRADGRVSVRDRRAQPRSARPRSRREILDGLADGSIDIVIGTHRLASARREVPQPGPADHRRRAAVRRRGEGAAQSAAGNGRRADDDRHADPADAAHVAVGPARHLEPGNAAGRPPGGRDARHAVRATS